MTVPTHSMVLRGNWSFGWALDWHTVPNPSFPGGYGRTPLGELLYRLKYGHDTQALDDIVDAVVAHAKTLIVLPRLDGIIPVPPSDTDRPFQPVEEIVYRVGALLNLPVLSTALVKDRPTPALKDISDPDQRTHELQGAFHADPSQLHGKWLLLIDDIYRSGATLNEVTHCLVQEGGAARVYVLALTRTRTLR